MGQTEVNIHAALIAQCRQHNRQAQFQLYKLYVKAMLNTAHRITGKVEDAEDVVQEAFTSAFKNIETYRGDASFGAWLKRIVINRALNLVNKNQLETYTDELPEVVESVTSNARLEVDTVKKAVMLLPQGFRNVLTLYLFEGYDHKEIAEILKISESTSKSQYKRAKDKLKELLKEEIVY